jgi:hypothetical protein
VKKLLELRRCERSACSEIFLKLPVQPLRIRGRSVLHQENLYNGPERMEQARELFFALSLTTDNILASHSKSVFQGSLNKVIGVGHALLSKWCRLECIKLISGAHFLPASIRSIPPGLHFALLLLFLLLLLLGSL